MAKIRKYTFNKQYEKFEKMGIDKETFREFYRDIRRANKKGRDMERRGNALFRIEYSRSLSRVNSVEDFNIYRDSLNRVLSPEYREKRNTNIRHMLHDNVNSVFSDDLQDEKGESVISKIHNFISELTDSELNAFYQENKDIKILIYESDDNMVQNIIDRMGFGISQLMDRISAFTG